MPLIVILFFSFIFSLSALDVVDGNNIDSCINAKTFYSLKLLNSILPWGTEQDSLRKPLKDTNSFFIEIKNKNAKDDIVWTVTTYSPLNEIRISAIDKKNLAFVVFQIENNHFSIKSFFDYQALPSGRMHQEYNELTVQDAILQYSDLYCILQVYDRIVEHPDRDKLILNSLMEDVHIQKNKIIKQSIKTTELLMNSGERAEQDVDSKPKEVVAKINFSELDFYKNKVVPRGIIFESPANAPVFKNKVDDSFFEIQKISDAEYRFIFDNNYSCIFKEGSGDVVQISVYRENSLCFQAMSASGQISSWSLNATKNSTNIFQLNTQLRLAPFEYACNIEYKKASSVMDIYLLFDNKINSLMLYRMLTPKIQ